MAGSVESNGTYNRDEGWPRVLVRWNQERQEVPPNRQAKATDIQRIGDFDINGIPM